MVRVNIIHPKKLADQHLVAEYLEIMMLLGHVKKYPNIKEIPEKYGLGKGHIKFFKNKLVYLKNRHEKIKEEMRKRDFKAKKTISLKGFPKELVNDWAHSKEDEKIIKERIRQKIKLKPSYYRYYGERKGLKFFIELLD